jgi:hypothetical protein
MAFKLNIDTTEKVLEINKTSTWICYMVMKKEFLVISCDALTARINVNLKND